MKKYYFNYLKIESYVFIFWFEINWGRSWVWFMGLFIEEKNICRCFYKINGWRCDYLKNGNVDDMWIFVCNMIVCCGVFVL